MRLFSTLKKGIVFMTNVLTDNRSRLGPAIEIKIDERINCRITDGMFVDLDRQRQLPSTARQTICIPAA